MQYTEMELKVKNITELKKLASLMGVARFSAKNQSELIRDILAIQEGKLSPVVHKRGRPNKTILEMDLQRGETQQNENTAENKKTEENNEEIVTEKVNTAKDKTDNPKKNPQRKKKKSLSKHSDNHEKSRANIKVEFTQKAVSPEVINKDELDDEKLKEIDKKYEDRYFEHKDNKRFILSDSQDFMTYDDYSKEAEPVTEHGEDETEFKHSIATPEIEYIKESSKSCKGQRTQNSEIREDIKSKKFNSVMNEAWSTSAGELNTQAFDIEGVLEILPENYGYLRPFNYYPSDADLYVPTVQIKRFSLRNGDKLKVKARFFPNNKYASVIFIYEINNVPCDQLEKRPNFEDLVPVYPTQRLRLEDGEHRLDTALRVIDLVSPIGRGQRGLIISPPKAGKTTLLKSIAQALLRNYNDIEVIILLVDERPEEVTDIQESVSEAEIVYSTFDMPPEHHTRVAELVMKNAKRRVELGRHVVILLDSITRLSRAYNQVTEQTGKTLTGGLDSAALFEPKRFFGAARSIRNGGSLTVIATALVDTGSKMDDIIYEEFKGTGNMEIHLSRRLSERRIFPAVDLNKSGTRREELLLLPKEMEGMWLLRRILSRADVTEATELLLDRIMATKNNSEFIDSLKNIK